MIGVSEASIPPDGRRRYTARHGCPADNVLPDDIKALKTLVRQQQHQLAALKASTDAAIAALREQLNTLLAKRFGPSSEKVAPDQIGLFNEAERICPHDGTPLERIGEATREQLDVIPAKIQVLRHIRVKYACPCCREHVVTAPAPPEILPKSNASAGLLAYVATAKYVDALPLARQAHILARAGIDLSRATLAGWMVKAGARLQPLVNLLRERLVADDFVQMDEMPIQVLKEDGPRAEHTSFMRVARGGPPQARTLLFHYAPSRASTVPEALLEGFQGTLLTDG